MIRSLRRRRRPSAIRRLTHASRSSREESRLQHSRTVVRANSIRSATITALFIMSRRRSILLLGSPFGIFSRPQPSDGMNAARLHVEDEPETDRARDRPAHRRPRTGVGDHRLLHADAVLLACAVRELNRPFDRAHQLLYDDHVLRVTVGEAVEPRRFRRCRVRGAGNRCRRAHSSSADSHHRSYRYISPCVCAATTRRAFGPSHLILTTLVRSRTLSL